MRFALSLALCVLVSTTLRAQTNDGERLLAEVAAAHNLRFRYAVLRPVREAPPGERPVLFVLDPRGRAMLGIETFRFAADSLGWLVLSSHDTASDDPNAPNVAAMNAMLSDALERWGADRRRLYVAGMSGTARVAFSVGQALPGNVAGVILAGAGLALDSVPLVGFAIASATGVRDFNWVEVQETRALFAGARVPTRWWTFDGAHTWPARETTWSMLRWLDRLAQGDSAVLVDGGESAAGARESQIQEIVAREKADQARAAQVLAELRRNQLQAHEATLRRRLGIDSLIAESEVADATRAAPARRRLAHLHVMLTFYEPRVYRAANEPTREALVRTLGQTLAAYAR